LPKSFAEIFPQFLVSHGRLISAAFVIWGEFDRIPICSGG